MTSQKRSGMYDIAITVGFVAIAYLSGVGAGMLSNNAAKKESDRIVQPLNDEIRAYKAVQFQLRLENKEKISDLAEDKYFGRMTQEEFVDARRLQDSTFDAQYNEINDNIIVRESQIDSLNRDYLKSEKNPWNSWGEFF